MFSQQAVSNRVFRRQPCTACSSPARNPRTFTATWSVTKITIYVVHHQPEHLPVIEHARQHLFGEHKPADTVVGVETLAGPGYLIEVDAIAVTDR